MITDIHKKFLLQCLSLAKKNKGFCAPNPSVGALIVKDGRIIAKGQHFGSGKPHAEINALKKAGDTAKNADLYISLEPCCHFGKTPPCTDAILKAGIRRVFYAFQDPNPLVAGQGEKKLLEQGIVCEYISVPAVDAFYQSYHYWMTTQKPWITAKIAISLDGKIAQADSQPIQLTGKKSQQLTHQYRCCSDAILTTINTILADDPQLNVRLSKKIVAKPIYILDSNLRLPLTATILHTAQSLTVFCRTDANAQQRHLLEQKGVRCISIMSSAAGLSLQAALGIIAQDGYHDVWVEAGAKSLNTLIQEKLLHRLLIYIAPKTLGPNALPAFLNQFNFLDLASKLTWRVVDEDVVCEIDFQ